MDTIKKLATVLSAGLAAGIVSFAISCDRRPLLVEGMTVRIEVDASYPMGMKVPELYRVFFYSREERKAVVSDFVGPEGGRIHLPAGEYLYLVYNFDLESTILDNLEGYDAVRAFTSRASAGFSWLDGNLVLVKESSAGGIISKAAEDEENEARMIYEPDALYIATGEVSVPHRSEEDEEMVITAEMKDALRHGTVKVHGLTGIGNIMSVTVYLTNLSGSMYLTRSASSQEPAVICFPCGYDESSGTMSGDFLSFGMLPKEYYTEYGYISQACVLVTDTAGGQYVSVEDITEQVVKYIENDSDMIIELSCILDVPEPGGDSGFLPTLDDWVPETVPIQLG